MMSYTETILVFWVLLAVKANAKVFSNANSFFTRTFWINHFPGSSSRRSLVFWKSFFNTPSCILELFDTVLSFYPVLMKRQLPSLFEDKRSHFSGQGICYGGPLSRFPGCGIFWGKSSWDMGYLEQFSWIWSMKIVNFCNLN